MVPSPTSDTRPWLQQLGAALEVIYQQGYEYKKAGSALMELCRDRGYQGDLLMTQSLPETTAMMFVLDAINRKYGRNTLRPGSVGFDKKGWPMNQQSLSQRYTTNWAEIVTVNAG